MKSNSEPSIPQRVPVPTTLYRLHVTIQSSVNTQLCDTDVPDLLSPSLYREVLKKTKGNVSCLKTFGRREHKFPHTEPPQSKERPIFLRLDAGTVCFAGTMDKVRECRVFATSGRAAQHNTAPCGGNTLISGAVECRIGDQNSCTPVSPPSISLFNITTPRLLYVFLYKENSCPSLFCSRV